MKEKVLFVCIHNSARSQIAEAFLKQLAGDRFEVESAGLEPGKLNPFVIQAMKEIGIDISHNKTKSVFDLFKQGKKFQYVIAVCDAEAAEKCPIFPTMKEKLHWSFPDPSSFQGTDEEKLAFTRTVRDEIKHAIDAWLKGM
ncbi:MAG: arsenate reductase ArsC [Candidatus Omnitrophica bacterium]|nr:arsenate reductase ArsC [Candidatus Omnitrophota bacterium]